MKTKLLTFFLAFFASISAAFADVSGTCGKNLTWSYDPSTGVLTITGTGPMTNWSYDTQAPWYSYRNAIKAVNLPDGLTSIGDEAFAGNIAYSYAFTSVTIPNSVTSIGESAFYKCTELTSVTIPNSVTSIKNYAFDACTGLTSVTIPNSITSIGDYVFRSCSGLTSVTIPNSVTSIGREAFRYCNGLTSVTIPNSVKTIGQYAFSGCSGLTSIIIPNSVTSIESAAFGNVANIVYNGQATGSPWGARSVNGYVDGYLVYSDVSKTKLLACSSSATGIIIIPNSVWSIGSSAFYGCSGLTSVTIPNSVWSIGSSAFYGCRGLTSINIPNSVTSIGNYAFDGCTGLTSVTIPNSVTSIGDYAFRDCYALTSVAIPNSVTSIGQGAFDGCKNLTSVILGNGLKTIINGVFMFCTKLQSITCYSIQPPAVTDYYQTTASPFYNMPYSTIVYVPADYLNTYMMHEVWGLYDVRPLDATTAQATDLFVTPHYTTADVAWPTVDNAATYELVITQNGTVVCTLVFNAQGQLTSIAFRAPAESARAAGQGFQFTVTGLEDGHAYSLTLNAKDAAGNVLRTFAKDFSTGYTAIEEVNADGVALKPRKVLEEGRVIILMPDGRKFDTNGRALGK